MDTSPSLIAELEDALRNGSKDKRVDSLRRITDLFVQDADRFNDHQIEVFNDVLGHLIKRLEKNALAELSRRLGPISNAPTDVVGCLARDDDIAVAGPILQQSQRLAENDLIEIANTKTKDHLLAISSRSLISSNVTDVLLRRGDAPIFHKLAGNSGANFSDTGFATLVNQSERDAKLVEKIGLRLDVPLRLFRQLLLRATEAVRARLLALAGPESRDHIQRVLANLSEDACHEAGFQNEHNYAEAQARVLAMRTAGTLNEATIFSFVKNDRYADMITAISLMCGTKLEIIEGLFQNEHREPALVACKAAGLGWPTVRAILANRSVAGVLSNLDMVSAEAQFVKLSQTGAQRVLRFWQIRKTAVGDDVEPAATARHINPDQITACRRQ